MAVTMCIGAFRGRHWAVLCAGLLLTGCSTGPDADAPARPSAETAGAAPGSTDGGHGYEATDALGRKLHFDHPPRRIALAGRALFMVADAVCMFPGAADRIVATGKTGQGSADFAALFDPEVGSKTVFPDTPGPEQIAEFKPDLVILKSYLAQSLGGAIDTLGMPVLYVEFETPDQYFRDLETLGRVFMQNERARELADYYHARMAAIQGPLIGLADADKPRVLLLYYSEKEGHVAFNVPPSSWIQTRMTVMAGGLPVWKDANPGQGWTSVTLEQILAWNPAVIFLVSYTRNPDDVVQGLFGDSTWRHVPALKARRIHAFAGDVYSWDQPSPRWILGLSWMAKKLHPGIFSDLDVISLAQEFYRTAYGWDAAVFREKVRPALRGDLH
jgi:iron complex transport system substrate-binding protein